MSPVLQADSLLSELPVEKILKFSPVCMRLNILLNHIINFLSFLEKQLWGQELKNKVNVLLLKTVSYNKIIFNVYYISF